MEPSPRKEPTTIEQAGIGLAADAKLALADGVRRAQELFDRLAEIRSHALGFRNPIGREQALLRAAVQSQRLHDEVEAHLRNVQDKRAELGIGVGRSETWALVPGM